MGWNKKQIDLLADYIMAEIPNEPSCSEGAGDTAIRLLKLYRVHLAKFGRHTAECNIYTWKEISDLAPANCDCDYEEAKEGWK